MIAILAAALALCPPATVDRWTHAPANLSTAQRLAILPVKPCLIEGETGPHRCSRKLGCINAAADPGPSTSSGQAK
jgi:hypothetical protein